MAIARTREQANQGLSLTQARAANAGKSDADIKAASAPGKTTRADGTVVPNATSGGTSSATVPVTTGTTPATGTLTAQITTPASAGKMVTPPAVITSDAAEKDLQKKKDQATQLQDEAAQHQAIVAGQKAPPVAPSGTATTTEPAPVKTSGNPDTLNEDIDSILNNLSGEQQTLQKNAAAEVDPYKQQQIELQQSFDSSAATALKKLNNIASGTYPLSAAEKSLLASTTAEYESTVQAQQTANQAYTGQMTELMASLGINTSAPTEAIGMIHAAISAGETKIADLHAKMAKAVADLQQGFQEQDYKMISDAWTQTSGYLKDRLDTLRNLQKDVLDASHQQQQDLKDFASLRLTTMIQSAQFSYQQKHDAVEDAFRRSEISETQRHNLATEALTREANGEGGGTFTKTQINQGAANAGVPVDTFKNWSADAKNVFINGNVKDTKTTIDDALKTGSIDEVQSAIKDMALPPEAQKYFMDYAKGQDTGESSLQKRTDTFADTFDELKTQGYDRQEALDEVTSEWSDGGKSPITKADQRIINQALDRSYGSFWDNVGFGDGGAAGYLGANK